MFERYTEKARRVIFFARYEASQYGSPYIESEHLLLGSLREDHSLALKILGVDPGEIRQEMESEVAAREPLPGSIEVPLSDDCKHILVFAAEEANHLGHKRIGPEHLVLGILRQAKCRAAALLTRRGVTLTGLRDNLRDRSSVESEGERSARRDAIGTAVDRFLEAWRAREPQRLASFFAPHGQFWDIHGELWVTPAQVERGLAAHFASAEGVEHLPEIRDVKFVTSEVAAVTLVWKPEPDAKMRDALAPRMILVLTDARPGWLVVSAHLALLQPGRPPATRKRQ